MVAIFVESRLASSKRLEATIRMNGYQAEELFIESNLELTTLADPWLAFLLPIAMKTSQDLIINGSISKDLASAIPLLQKQYLLSQHKWSEIRVQSENSKQLDSYFSEGDRRSATFFSGGLDSTFTALSFGKKCDLIAVHGFDIPINNEKHWRLAQAGISEFAGATENVVVEIATNLRVFSDKFMLWGQEYFGAALAGISFSLAKSYEKIMVSSGVARGTTAWGAFPELFETFCNPNLQLIDFGLQSRAEKARFVDMVGFSKFVRVCWQNLEGRMNCGNCQKCRRTKFEFEYSGCSDFPSGLEDPSSITGLFMRPISRIEKAVLIEDFNWLKASGKATPMLFTTLLRFSFLLGIVVGALRAHSPLWLKKIYRRLRGTSNP